MEGNFERLFDLDLFRGVTESQQARIRSACRKINLKSGEILFTQGAPATAFYFVLEGWVTVSRIHESGASTVLHVFGANESFAEIAAMAIGDYPASADAATNASVLSIPSKDYRALIEEDTSFAMRVIGSLAQRMKVLIEEFESSQHASGPSRLAGFLLELTERSDPSNGRYELPFSKQMLAARLHMQPETLSRAFSDLRNLGIESSRDGHIHIPDRGKLEELVNN